MSAICNRETGHIAVPAKAEPAFALVSQGLKVHIVHGDHEIAVEEPQIQVWVGRLKDCLGKAQADPSAEN